MLTTEEFRAQIKDWMKQEKWDLVRASSKKRLEAMGYIDLGVGSFVRWIEPAWFEEAKRREVIAQDNHGHWIPVVQVDVDEQVVGRQGRKTITEAKTRIDHSAFSNFMRDYEAFKEKQRAREYYSEKEQKENQALVNAFKF